MKKYSSVLFFTFLVLVFHSCASTNHNARNSLDWDGIYTGAVPGANSEINVEITLNRDRTYKVSYQYIDKSNEVFTHTGMFKWKDGNTIVLDNKGIPPYYKLGKNTLTQMDMKGKSIGGEFANQYVYKKIN